MATVYLATDTKLNRSVAIKVLRPELAEQLGADRFLREIETTASLLHSSIMPLYDSGEIDGRLDYVGSYVDGGTLRDRILAEKHLTIDDSIRLTREIAGALSAAHGRGVVHRDIKPENILLDAGRAIITDFGIAKAVDMAGGERLTSTGMALGTPLYMSPEQASASPDIDERSDIYALGCVLFEMLAGEPPYKGNTPESVIRQHVAAPVPSVTALRPTVPQDLADVITKAMAKIPADRYQSADQLDAELKLIQAGEAIVRRPPASTRLTSAIVTKKRIRASAITLLSMLLLSAGWWWLSSRTTIPPPRSATRIMLRPITTLGSQDIQVLGDAIPHFVKRELRRKPGIALIGQHTTDLFRDSTAQAMRNAAQVDFVVEMGAEVNEVASGEPAVLLLWELVDTTDGTVTWTGDERATVADLQNLSVALAHDISREVGIVLSEVEPSNPPSDNQEALALFYEGVVRLERTGPQRVRGDSLARTVAYLEGAVAPVYSPGAVLDVFGGHDYLKVEALILLSELDSAVTVLDSLVHGPSHVTPAILRLDPFLKPLHDHPRFRELAELNQ